MRARGAGRERKGAAPARGRPSRARLSLHCFFFWFPLRPVFLTQPTPSPTPQVLSDVRSIIAEQLGAELDTVGADAKFVDLGADSLDTVEIMMALEEKFEVTLDEEGAEGIATVQDAADMIAAKLG